MPILREALALHQSGRLEEARRYYLSAIQIDSRSADAYHFLGVLEAQTGANEAAAELIAKAIAINPKNAAFHYNRGIALQALGRFDEALKTYDKALKLKPDLADVYNNRGNVLQALNRLPAALFSYDKALALNPGNAQAHNNRGNVLLELQRYDEAVDSFSKALTLRPDYALAFFGRGEALGALNNFDESLSNFEAALALAPDHAAAHHGRGNALYCLGRHEQAIASYDTALRLNPDNIATLISCGHALHAFGRFEEAVVTFTRASVLQPDNAETYADRALSLQELKRFEEAFASYDLAFALQPDLDFLLGSRLFAKMGLCDWAGLTEDLGALRAGLESRRKVTPPFAALGALSDAKLQRAAAEIWIEGKHPSSQLRFWPSAEAQRKVRVGYFSADLQDHATTHLMAQLFEEHDRERFEFYAFSFGPESNDAMRQRISAEFHQFIDVRNRSDRQVAELSRQIGIDIAVDLKGFTKGSRPGLFVERCAPIQVNYLGYPGTTGGNFLDYIVADRILIPEDQRTHFSEKVVYLPNSYQPNDATRRISDRAFTKRELGLPETGFVFCCFNNSFKIFPETFGSWVRILQAVEGSVLWLLRTSPSVEANLRKEAAARGLDDRRLVFAERMPTDEHLARQRLADLFLDTLPCNAHTTASDALWAGLPVLTLIGSTFAGRVAASLLHAIGLPELVTESQASYEAMAIKFATDPRLALEIKRKLEQNRTTSPLFDAKKLARHIEAAYDAMHSRRQAGLAPEVIEIEV